MQKNSNKNINKDINSNTMLLDSRITYENDNKDIMPLDTRVKHEYDNEEIVPENDNSVSSSCHSQIKIPSSCHSRAQTRESSRKMNHCFSGYSCQGTNMTRMTSQSGRSMVEMLGVLAIIGVLSIGGIMGYSYGMDKYRANETINQIMLRAIDLMTQAGNGNETLSLSAWEKEPAQYTFGEVGYTHDGLIYLDVSGLPKQICEIVYDNLYDMAVQIDINAVRADSNATCGEDNEMTFYFEGGIGGACDPACPEGQYCDNGICFKGGVPELSKALKECSAYSDGCSQCYSCEYNENSSTRYMCQSLSSGTCTIDGKDGLCRNGECYPKGCTTNDDCKEVGTYCASTNSSCTERFQSTETGSCAKLDFVKKEFGGQTYYISNTTMSWWDAEYACAAIGGNVEMVGITDLIEESTWNGSYDIDVEYTPFGQELSTVIGFGLWFWTKDLTNNSCMAFHVFSGSCSVGDYGRRNDYYNVGLAVCR